MATGMGSIKLRKIEGSREIAATLAKAINVAYLPNVNNMLLGLNPSMAGLHLTPPAAVTILATTISIEANHSGSPAW
ncbi:hypothetical protein ACSBR1_012775 [Camellia fascicularis]